LALHPDGRTAYTLSRNRPRVDVLSLPLPPVSVYLVPLGYEFGAGESVRFEARITNHTDERQTFEARVDVLKPNGNPFPGNPVLGPVTKGLPAGRTLVREVGFRIGGGVPPSGPYTVRATIETAPGGATSTSSFRFLVE